METDPRLVTETNEKIVEGVQMFNSVCATVIGLSIHSYILYRISKNYSTLNSYQHLIVVQSVISLVSVAIRFIANQRTTLYEQNVLFLPFLSIGEVVETITLSILIFLDSLDMFLIITLNIHRVLLFMKPNWVRKFYVLFVPFACAYSITRSLSMALLMDVVVELVLQASLVVMLIVATICCYIRIRKHFRIRTGYTETVKRMQGRLSTSIVLQAVLYSILVVAWAFAPVFIIITIAILGISLAAQIVVVCYSLILLTLFRWYPVATGLLILYSIRGFLTPKAKPATGDGQRKITIASLQPLKGIPRNDYGRLSLGQSTTK
ncbi:hypothetical protein Q1695_014621 [Nippostrongylus brasiliensis]|nr:hypothetical protein Q1695_014621 [Nippostrongylus brasiliensis]